MSSAQENKAQANEKGTELETKFKEILLSNGITENVSEVIIKDAGLKGEGFSSLTKLVTVIFEDSHVQPLNLFVKVHTQLDSHNAMLEEMKAFEKEATFLVKYVNAANDMCKQKGHEGFIDFYPKCYYGDEKMIVLENLVLDKGYETANMDIRQNLEEAKSGVVTLAKHQAIGYVMIQECGGAEKFFEMFPNLDYECYDKPNFAAMMEPGFDMSINFFVKLLDMCDIPGSHATTTKLKGFLGRGWNIVLDALKIQKNENLLGLGHGDYWNNNMMFLKDKETNEILHNVAIDFQITRYNSAGIDLGYYFFTSVQPKVRQKHLHELLELYINTFNSITEDFGYPTNVTFEETLLDFKKSLGFGFWLGLTIAVGPVMAICKEADLPSVDPNLWFGLLNNMMTKWIDQNPDKTVELAEELIALMKEYDNLSLQE